MATPNGRERDSLQDNPRGDARNELAFVSQLSSEQSKWQVVHRNIGGNACDLRVHSSLCVCATMRTATKPMGIWQLDADNSTAYKVVCRPEVQMGRTSYVEMMRLFIATLVFYLLAAVPSGMHFFTSFVPVVPNVFVIERQRLPTSGKHRVVYAWSTVSRRSAAEHIASMVDASVLHRVVNFIGWLVVGFSSVGLLVAIIAVGAFGYIRLFFIAALFYMAVVSTIIVVAPVIVRGIGRRRWVLMAILHLLVVGKRLFEIMYEWSEFIVANWWTV